MSDFRSISLAAQFAPQVNPNNNQLYDTKTKGNIAFGTQKTLEVTYIVPSVAANAPQIGDRIIWGKLPRRAKPLGHMAQLSWSAGAASSTLTVGDPSSPARHLAATSVTVAGSAIPNLARANGATFETSDDSSNLQTGVLTATDDCTLVSVVAGAALQPGQVLTLLMPFEYV